MASTNSTRDGMGGEELNQAGSQISTLFMTGSITTQSDLNVAGTISGTGTLSATIISGTDFRTGSLDATGGITALQTISGLNVLAQASGTFGVVGDADGANGTFTLTDLPLKAATGNWFLETCDTSFNCNFLQVTLNDGVSETVTMEIFVP